MSVENRAVKAVTITSGLIAASAGTLIVREVLKRRGEIQSREFTEQAAGDSGFYFKRDGSRLR